MELVFKDKVNLKGVFGVEVDGNNNVYVCSNGVSVVFCLIENFIKW